jgi:hypothetical protein
MRTCALLAVLLGACASDSDPDVHIERQSATVANANAASWAEGGAVLVGVPGTFSFPQPLSLRISVVDSKKLDENGVPAQLKIMSATIATYGSGGELQVVSAPSCAANYCTAELTVSAMGASMLTVSAVGPDGTQNDCFYYGVFEDADPSAVGATQQTALETQQADCRASYWK